MSEVEIQLTINDQRYDMIESEFTEHKFCLSTKKVDKFNDIFHFYAKDSVGFCIESFFANEKKILGSNSAQNNCGDVGMATSEIKIKNGEVIYYECKGK